MKHNPRCLIYVCTCKMEQKKLRRGGRVYLFIEHLGERYRVMLREGKMRAITYRRGVYDRYMLLNPHKAREIWNSYLTRLGLKEGNSHV